DIARVAGEPGLTAFTLTGETSTEDRGRGSRGCQDGKTHVFITQTPTGGIGITLTAADTAICYSADFSLANYDQAKARLHRIGQKRPVTYIHLVVKDSIDEEVIRRLAKKQDIARLVVDELRKILEGGDTVKKPYEGLQPGTEAWRACWRKYPELQNEMLEYKQRLEEGDDMEHKKASKVVELEQQVEQAVEEVERILEEEDFEQLRLFPLDHTVTVEDSKETVASEAEEELDKKEPKKTVEQLRLFPPDRIVTVKDLAEELGTQPKTLRKWLRKNVQRASGRWEWEAGSPELDEIRAKYRREHGGGEVD